MGGRPEGQRPQLVAGVAMARLSAARKVAFLVLGEVRRRDARARDVLRSSAKMEDLDERDRALATRLVLGVVSSSGLLDDTVDAYVKAGMRLQPKVRDALRLGAFELLFLETPEYVAVSQGVELARLATPRAVGLANAVLRKVAKRDRPRRRDALDAARDQKASIGELAFVSGYPEWILRAIQDDWGVEGVHELALASLEPPPVYVATNELLHTVEQTRELLQEADLGPRDCGLEGAFVLESPAGLARSGLVGTTQVIVSDLSAQRVAQMVAPRSDVRLLEIGQGRGTKTLLLLSACKRSGARLSVVGVDSEPFKVEVARRRIQASKASEEVRCFACDARDLEGDVCPVEVAGEFDVVFVDAPCSGTGTMRRHPETPWSLGESDIETLAEIQGSILAAAASRVRDGGLLYYATCSALMRENDGVVQGFLSSDRGKGFELEGDPLQTLPSVGGPDGHFCACLRKTLA